MRPLLASIATATWLFTVARPFVVDAADVPYVPTPPEVVARMLQMAQLRAGDIVYDLGCGDGRIVIAAVRTAGVRGVCVEIDPDRLAMARSDAEQAVVDDRIRFVEGDLFKVPLTGATVVTLYLLPDVNLRLRPRLLRLPAGTRIVSHAFDMGDWFADRTEVVPTPGGSAVVFGWTVPARRR
jgi:SAM-dependent methyltransferase